MKVFYITKTLPFGSDEAFIFAEIADHLRNGLDIAVVPVQTGKLVHDEGRALLARSLPRSLLDRQIIADLLSEAWRHPGRVFSSLVAIIDPKRPRLWPRNLAVWPKGVWLGVEARRRRVDHIHAHWLSVPATMALVASRISGISFSITAHRYDIAQKNLVPLKSRSARFLRAIDMKGCGEIAEQLRPGDPMPDLIRMGVPLAERVAPLRDGFLSVLRVAVGARFIEKKGHETLIRSVAEARKQGLEITVDLMGDGPLESRLRALAHDLDVAEHLRFLGTVSHDDLVSRLSSGAYDVAVLPSVTASDGDKEGIPVFLMEAMGAGLPVISTPNGGISELIVDGCGILVPERDVSALAQALLRVAADGALRTRLAVAGLTWVREQYSLAASGTRLRNLMLERQIPDERD